MPRSDMRHFVSRRERAANNICTAECRISAHARMSPDFQMHVCELSAEHWGVHLCWCGCAFNDIGELFTQRPLPGMPPAIQPERDDGSTWLSPDWTAGQ